VNVLALNLKNGFVGDAFVYLTEAKADELKNANAFAQDIVITHRGTFGRDHSEKASLSPLCRFSEPNAAHRR
jgi:hypothetical protein